MRPTIRFRSPTTCPPSLAHSLTLEAFAPPSPSDLLMEQQGPHTPPAGLHPGANKRGIDLPVYDTASGTQQVYIHHIACLHYSPSFFLVGKVDLRRRASVVGAIEISPNFCTIRLSRLLPSSNIVWPFWMEVKRIA
jgi:hypothetical protein